MICTPTYYTFELYREHQDAELLGSWLETGEIGDAQSRIPGLSHTASVKEGKLTLTISNLSLWSAEEIDCYLLGFSGSDFQGRVLRGEMAAHNTFEEPGRVRPEGLQGIEKTAGGFRFWLPPCSLAEITIANRKK